MAYGATLLRDLEEDPKCHTFSSPILPLHALLHYPIVCFGFLKAKWKVVWPVAYVFDISSTVLECPPTQEYPSEIVKFPFCLLPF